jgi:rhodanese-related sulfurtransferase
VLGLDEVDVDEVSPQALIQLSAGGVTVIDLSASRNYHERHIPGSWFALRSRLDATLPTLPAAPLLVLTSEDGVLARLAAAEVAALTTTPVKVLDGGNAAWAAAGLPLAGGFENMASAADDAWLRPYDRDAGTDDAMQQYLSWEVGLLQQIDRDATARFGLPKNS